MTSSASGEKRNITVLTVVAILLLSLTFNSLCMQQDVTVEEGQGEIDLEYIKPNTGEYCYNETTDSWYYNATAFTYVDGKNNSLKFKVILEMMDTYSNYDQIVLKLKAKGEFNEKYDVDEFLFTMQGLEGKNVSSNMQGFSTEWLETEGLKIWPTEEQNSGSRGTEKSYIGFDVNDNEFSAEVKVDWHIPKDNWNNSYTLRLQSVVKGMEEEVASTVDVNIEE